MAIPEQKVVILMADDDEDDRWLVEEVFKELCIQCCLRFVHDGVELKDYLNKRPPFEGNQCVTPDLILLDFYMPHMNGLEALAKIRAEESTKLIPVIMLSTAPNELLTRRAYALGANAVLRIPATFDKLKDTINALKSFWLQYAELPTLETAGAC
jgi:two-component system, response regulator